MIINIWIFLNQQIHVVCIPEADLAQQEAGLHMNGPSSNGYTTPSSQYHTPAGTPDAPIYANTNSLGLKPGADILMDLDGTSESETSSLGGSSVGGSSLGEGSIPAPPPPPPPPPPGLVPPPPPPPGMVQPPKGRPSQWMLVFLFFQKEVYYVAVMVKT